MGGDYSRNSFNPLNDFSSVLEQQGRVHLDADTNEQAAIVDRRWRAETTDIMGRAVVPSETKDGFRIELTKKGELLIHPGRMYVDGLLAENHGRDPDEFDGVLAEKRSSTPFPYSKQPHLHDAPPLPSGGPHLVYLDVWHREVTYLQHDLIEKAVGVDTTTRMKTVWQVKVLELKTESSITCADDIPEWDTLTTASAGRLTTEIAPSTEPPDLCKISPSAGYRGGENRLYRIEIHKGGGLDAAKFKWSRVNATVASSIDGILSSSVVAVTSLGRDDYLRIEIGDWVEILDDYIELRGEAGHMAKVVDIDEEKRELTIDPPLPDVSVFDTTDEDRYTRVIRWDQNVDADGLVEVSSDPIDLDDGIQITFSIDSNQPTGELRVADHWVFYARADGSIQELTDAPPAGIHHHYAKLALVTFPSTLVDDCRIHWPPPTRSEGCCTLTVGDGKTSYGDFDSIQAAVNNIPARGGKVCLLPGDYSENVHINGRTNITIVGCGDRSTVVSDAKSDEPNTPVIHIENSSKIRIESISTQAHRSAIGILVEETPGDPDGPSPYPVEDIYLSNLDVTAAYGSGIDFRGGQRLTIQGCRITMRDVPTMRPGIFLIGKDALIEKNVITVDIKDNTQGVGAIDFTPSSSGAKISSDTKSPRGIENLTPHGIGYELTPSGAVRISGRGGVQIGGDSERIRILENLIQYGIGDGITLGSLEQIDETERVTIAGIASPRLKKDPCDPCSPLSPVAPPWTITEVGEDEPPRYQSAGTLDDVLIARNRIYDMGRNGIGVAAFFDLSELDEFISADRLTIRENDIRQCLNRPLAPISDDMVNAMGYGGIALSDVSNLVIQHNDIQDNGPDYLEPVCGIFVLHAEGVDITDNRIVNNGAKTSATLADVKRGRRGGIHIVYAVTPTILLGDEYPRQNGIPAAKIHDNIVTHPMGRALTVGALGPVSVVNNQFTSRGVVNPETPWMLSSVAATVMIVNLGLSNEFYWQISRFSALKGDYPQPNTFIDVDDDGLTLEELHGLDDLRIGRYLSNGNVLFSDNQCVLDLLDSSPFRFVVSAVAIASLDDVGFQNNQCDCSLVTGKLWFPNFVLSPSLRVSDNRFKESVWGAWTSAVTFGLMNATTGNQATHCLLVLGLQELSTKAENRVISDWLLSALPIERPFCDLLKDIAQQYLPNWKWL